MKRFWDTVAVDPVGEEYRVLLDGKPIHLPNGGVLRIGPPALAAAVAEEWSLAGGAKGGDMSFADTPLTRLAGTARERIAPDPLPTADAVARYGETDLLCYRAEAPEELVQLQARSWQPWLDWAASTYDAPLRVTTGISAIRQHRDSIAALRRAVGTYDPHMLAGLGIVVPALGSLILGLALAEGLLDAAQAHTLGALEELFQMEQWGEDDEAAVRRKNVAADIALAARFMRLARAGG
ncbi:MAG: chaperone, ATP12 [Acetobacteraceae bacterium]|nr:chaperone, ATP12 [Acetobacteraceae bacterium]